MEQVNDSRAEARRLLNEAERNIGGPAQEPEHPRPLEYVAVGDSGAAETRHEGLRSSR